MLRTNVHEYQVPGNTWRILSSFRGPGLYTSTELPPSFVNPFVTLAPRVLRIMLFDNLHSFTFYLVDVNIETVTGKDK